MNSWKGTNAIHEKLFLLSDYQRLFIGRNLAGQINPNGVRNSISEKSERYP